MLSFQTVLPDTLELLKVLMRLPILKHTRLVGGTSLALQYGHRRSVDLDFFGHTTEDIDELTSSEYRALLNMAYFDDAEPQPIPFIYEEVEWETIKNSIRKEVEKYNQKSFQV
jgi:hypothetical protein